MFKVGDVVEVLENRPQGSFFKKGDKYTIVRISGVYSVRYYGFNPRYPDKTRLEYDDNYVCARDLKLVDRKVKSHLPEFL